MVDWKKIKAEYIAGGTSYRKLCEKYGVSRTTLQTKAKDEKWPELRSQTQAKTEAKIIDSVSTNEAKKAASVIEVADKLLDKITEIMDGVATTQDIRHLTSALKDLRDIKGYKSDADMREQEARIRNLEHQIKKDENTVGKVEVVFSAGEDSWNE